MEDKPIRAKSKDKEKKSLDLNDLKDFLLSFLPVIRDYWEHSEEKSRQVNNVFYIMLLFLGVVIVVVSWLTYTGHVSGDALLFFIGTVVGYVLAFMLELAKKTWFT